MDWARIAMLLELALNALQFPQLKPLHDAALAEVKSLMDAQGEKQAEKEPEPVAEEDPTISRRAG